MGVALFLFLAFIPATLFFLLVMMCSIDISLGPMNAALCIVQTFISLINRIPSLFVFRSSNFLSNYLEMFMLNFWGIWNLDFFRYVIPPFCIGKSLTLLQSTALHLIPLDCQTISKVRFIVVPLIFSYVFAVLRPYKRHIYNVCDSLFFFLYALCIWLVYSPYLNKLSIVLVYVYTLFGVIYISFFIVIKILKTVTPGFYDMCQRKFLRSAHNLILLCKDGDTENIHKLDESAIILYLLGNPKNFSHYYQQRSHELCVCIVSLCASFISLASCSFSLYDRLL